MARAAALLEEADAQFGATIHSLDSYKLHYGAYMDDQRLQEEIEILQMVLDRESKENRPGAALRLARIFRATGEWSRVVEILSPYVDVDSTHRVEVNAEHGHALCRQHENSTETAEFRKGRAEIDGALKQAQGDLRSRVLEYRAWVSSRIPDNEKIARDHYREAFESDSTNPFHLASFLEYEIFSDKQLRIRPVMKPVLRAAIQECRDHITAGIELHTSFFAMGRFHLLLEEPYESLAAYAKGIDVCLREKSTIPTSALDAEIKFIIRINRAEEMQEKHVWVYEFLQLAKTIKERPKRKGFVGPVVILAGDTTGESAEKLQSIGSTLKHAFEGFAGTLISGGTPVGVAGIAGEIADALKASGRPAKVKGYIPKSLPHDQRKDLRYTELIPSEGRAFSALEPLLYWKDLLAAEIPPTEVRVIGIDGGPISAVEYCMALAFGAKVALIEPSSLSSAAAVAQDPDWSSNRNLLPFPADPMAIRAFVNPPHPPLDSSEVEAAAIKIHESYLRASPWENKEPATKHWTHLREDFKASNRMQAERMAGFIETAGYHVRRASGPIVLPKFSKEETDLMAEMEHGRWMVERLQNGWRFGATRDTAAKTHDSLVPWSQLPESEREKDRKFVQGWPDVLAEAGFEVVRD
jgi:hypothetical protein